MSAPFKTSDVFLVEPSRLASGAWCHTKERQIGEGDIHASYSADKIGLEGKVRRPFNWQNGLWVRQSLKTNVSIYRKVVRELHAYRKAHASEPLPNICAPVHTSMGLKLSHIYNDFGHLELLDSLPQQVDLFDLL